MSDYEVTLVNDNMQEFYVRFHGPEECMFYFNRFRFSFYSCFLYTYTSVTLYLSTFCRWCMESSCRTP